VFRKVNAIEERTGVRFFDRLPSGYRMTEAGEAAMACGERVENEVHALGREILGQDLRIAGHVRVTAPEGLVALTLPVALTEFSAQHPDVSIELVGTASALSLSRREAEVAIRATRRPPDLSLGKKVCTFRVAVYASPDFLKRHEGVPLAALDWCLLGGIIDWLVPLVWKKRQDADEHVVLSTSSVVSSTEAAAAGLGVTLLPCYMGEPDDRLVVVGEPLEALTLELWVLTHPDLRHTARVRVLMDFLHEYLLQRRQIFEGPGGP
jgi:DNA-binding transcriptional LysR family regulator